jgi:hypothetical protein
MSHIVKKKRPYHSVEIRKQKIHKKKPIEFGYYLLSARSPSFEGRSYKRKGKFHETRLLLCLEANTRHKEKL